jgi:uncharacterized membrane protein (UPF0136 family)
MHINAALVLWIYIVLLFLGGLMGFLKAGSKISLMTSSCFAAALILCNVDFIFKKSLADSLAMGILIFLLVFFSYRLAKAKKFMPNGLMAVLTLTALVLRNIKWR